MKETRTEAVFFAVMWQLGAPRRLVLRCWKQIAAGYGKESRHYHVIAHIDAMLAAIEEFGSRLLMPIAVRLAAICHDVEDTEEASAEFARRWLTEMGCHQALIDAVVQLVLMTKGHRPLEGLLAYDSALLSDCDLLILAAPRKRYVAYTRQVRQEYSHYDDLKFNAGRKSVMESFCTRYPIYFTLEIHRRYEKKARANLAFELRQLAAALAGLC